MKKKIMLQALHSCLRLMDSEKVIDTSLPPCWENQHAIYVHAGLETGRHLSQSSPWIIACG